MAKKIKKTKDTEPFDLGQSMIRGMQDMLAYARGEKNHGCVVHHVHVPEKVDVKAIRKRVRMSQDQFAKNYGFSKRTLEHWEQGKRSPTGASRAFLMVIAREPEAVSRALAG